MRVSYVEDIRYGLAFFPSATENTFLAFYSPTEHRILFREAKCYKYFLIRSEDTEKLAVFLIAASVLKKHTLNRDGGTSVTL